MNSLHSKKRQKNRGIAQISAIVFVLVVILAAVLIFIYRDRLGGQKTSGSPDDTLYTASEFTYESGANQVYATVGNGLAVASITGVQLIDAEGNTVVRHITSLNNAAVCAGKSSAVFYDVGGTALYVADMDGTCTEVEIQTAIIAANLNEDGFLTVCTEETGYKGLVTVYNSKLEEIYRWYSGTGYLLKAVLSPDGRTMAALTVDTEGTSIHIFSLQSEEEKAVYTAPGELFFDISFPENGHITALSQGRAAFVDTNGREDASYSFEDLYLIDYSIDNPEFVTICLAKYRTGNGGTLITMSHSGSVSGQLDLTQDLINISSSGRRLLAYSSDGLTLYDRGLTVNKHEENVVGAKWALLQPSGDALLIYSYYAEPFAF